MESQIDHNFLRLGPNKESTLFLLNVISIHHYFLKKVMKFEKKISIYVKSELISNVFIMQMPISALKQRKRYSCFVKVTYLFLICVLSWCHFVCTSGDSVSEVQLVILPAIEMLPNPALEREEPYLNKP